MIINKVELKRTKPKARKKLPKVRTFSVQMGCDPEFFFTVNNKVVGAEKFIPKNGLVVQQALFGDVTSSKVIIDGVQAELNPRPKTCRAYMVNEISLCFKKLKIALDESGEGAEVSFKQTVKIGKKALEGLDKENQKFGCAPSSSSYGKDTSIDLEKVDPLKMLSRSAGGHIHIGNADYNNPVFTTNVSEVINTRPEDLVKMLDIIVGNTCVLIDRDKGNKKRRELYGRAGEFRLPPHGLEYRTLSNFWLRSGQLTSLVFGLVRLTVQLSCSKERDYVKDFLEAVDLEEIQEAINTNSVMLAEKNWNKIKPLLKEVVMADNGHHPIVSNRFKEFDYFVKMVRSKGLEYWFPETDMIKYWTTCLEGHHLGFNDFLSGKVNREMVKNSKKKKAKKAVKRQVKL